MEKTVLNFNVAHSEKFKNAQGVQQDKTIWVECAYWTDRTGLAPYLKKGTQVFLEGAPEVRTYTTKEGQPGASLSVRVFNLQLLGGRSEAPGAEQGGASGYQHQPANTVNQTVAQPVSVTADVAEPMDDLPF